MSKQKLTMIGFSGQICVKPTNEKSDYLTLDQFFSHKLCPYWKIDFKFEKFDPKIRIRIRDHEIRIRKKFERAHHYTEIWKKKKKKFEKHK